MPTPATHCSQYTRMCKIYIQVILAPFLTGRAVTPTLTGMWLLPLSFRNSMDCACIILHSSFDGNFRRNSKGKTAIWLFFFFLLYFSKYESVHTCAHVFHMYICTQVLIYNIYIYMYMYTDVHVFAISTLRRLNLLSLRCSECYIILTALWLMQSMSTPAPYAMCFLSL